MSIFSVGASSASNLFLRFFANAIRLTPPVPCAAVIIPKITTEFGHLDDVAWYGSVYSLARMALQPTYGRLYYCMRLKPTFCASIALFCAGSVICALSKDSPTLIGGRAVQGCGCAGITAGVLSIIAFIVPKEKMPIFIAIVSSVYAVSSVLGPIIGGVLTESRLTWRFCFWINLRVCSFLFPLLVYSTLTASVHPVLLETHDMMPLYYADRCLTYSNRGCISHHHRIFV